MAIPQTDFINGVFLSFPIGNYAKLFAVLETRTKRGFFEKIKELDGKDGEGTSPEQLVGMFQVGLMPAIPGVTFEQAQELMQEYIIAYGDQALQIKLVDAFCDSGLSDRKEVEKQRKMIEELEKLQDARNEAFIRQSWVEVENLNAELQKRSEDLKKATEESAGPTATEEGPEEPETERPLEGQTSTSSTSMTT